jgi:hypothetical protein
MTYDPITDIRLVELRERISLGKDLYEDKFIGYKIQYRRLGKYKDSDWVTATTIKEFINDRKDNSFASNLQRSVREEDPSVS